MIELRGDPDSPRVGAGGLRWMAPYSNLRRSLGKLPRVRDPLEVAWYQWTFDNERQMSF